MLSGALITVYMAQTLFFPESCYLFVTQYCFFFYPIFSQRLAFVLPTLAFIALTFVSVGKKKARLTRSFTCPNHAVVLLFEGGEMKEMFREPQREKPAFKSDHYQIES